jgi:hypothetical protein
MKLNGISDPTPCRLLKLKLASELVMLHILENNTKTLAPEASMELTVIAGELLKGGLKMTFKEFALRCGVFTNGP